MLELQNVSVFYASIQVLWDVSLRVNKGEIVSLIGPNGAGKSTLLRTILGMMPLRSGSIMFQGEPINGAPPHKLVGRGIIYVPEGRRVFPALSVAENLELGAMSPTAQARREENLRLVLDLFPALRERQDQLAGTLSGGEMQMVALARGLMGAPKLLMIDEPSFGLAPKIASQVFDLIRDIHGKGTTVLLVEQDVTRALGLADTAYVLENGHIVLEGPGRDLLGHEHIRQAYVGL